LLADRYINAYFFCSLALGRQWTEAGLIRDPSKIKEVMEISSSFSPIDKESARSVTGVQGEMNFLWIGGLHQRKDPLLAIRGFLLFQKTEPTAKLYMIFQSDELLNEVCSLIEQTQAPVVLVGKLPHGQLLHWYNSVHYIVSTSWYEGGGISVCEAMSCGCIPILTSIPSFCMMTDNGRIGVLFEPGDESGLAAALKNALSLDKKLERLKVLDRFDRKLSFEAIASDMIDVITKN
jgi:glycosyltransferase involved in cell wall biosynthesis